MKLSRSCFSQYIDKVVFQIKCNSKAFWKYIGQLKESKNLPSTMFLNNNSVSDGLGISNLIASHLESVYKNDPTSPLPPGFFIFLRRIINWSFATVYDLYTRSRLIYNCMFTLLELLKMLFNKSISSVYFSSAWKTAFITPIQKSGNKKNILN